MSKDETVQENAQKKVMTREVSTQEMKGFLAKYDKKGAKKGKHTDTYIEEEFETCLEALEAGNLVFNEHKVPTLTLFEPLYKNAENQALVKKTVTFKSRIRQAEKVLVMDGLNLEKQQGTYVLKVMSYMTQLSLTDIKNLESEDYEILNQICSVF